MSMIRQPQPNDICIQLDDLLDAYALDALEVGERRFVEAHLDGCLQQRDRLVELEQVLSIVGQAVTPLAPPPAVWERLAAETTAAPRLIQTTPPRPTPIRAIPESSPSSKVVTMRRWVAWAGGLAAALLLASTVGLGAALQRQGDDDSNEDPLVEMVARGGEVVPLSTQPQPAGISEVGQGSILTAPGMTPAVVVDHWTPSNEELQYLVWMAAAGGGEATVLGEIEIGEDGHGILVLNGVTTFEGFEIFGISIKTTADAGLQDVLLGEPPDQVG